MKPWQKIFTILIGLSLASGIFFIAGCQPSGETAGEETIAGEESVPVVGTRVGDIAPDFQVQDMNGENISLNSWRGTPVVLNFWATWCGPCVGEMPLFQQVYDESNPEEITMLFVNLGDTAGTVDQFLKDNGLSLPVMLDIKRATGSKYNISGIPTTFFIDKDGIIQGKVVGAFPSKSTIERYIDNILE